MRGVDILKSLYIFFIFLIIMFWSIILSNITNIKKEWPEYRCSPLIIPFASYFGEDVQKNFVYCIQNMQSGFMGHLLKPLHYSLGLMTATSGSLIGSVNDIRKYIAKIRGLISSITKDIFGVFYGIMIEFERIIIKTKDMFERTIAILVVQLYPLSGTMMTGQSVWRGPPGEIMRALCFHPDTLVKLKDEKVKKMKEIELNDELYQGGSVIATMNISNITNNGKQKESFYKISGGENNEPIYVTGDHLIYDTHNRKFIKIKNHIDSVVKPNLKSDKLSCLITSTNTISIGRRLFHDWEDNLARETERNIKLI